MHIKIPASNTKFGRHLSLGKEGELRRHTEAEVSLLSAKLANVATDVSSAFLYGASLPAGSTITLYLDILDSQESVSQTCGKDHGVCGPCPS